VPRLEQESAVDLRPVVLRGYSRSQIDELLVGEVTTSFGEDILRDLGHALSNRQRERSSWLISRSATTA
jgi:hypothetical protein